MSIIYTTPTVPSNAVMDISWKAPRCAFVNSTWHGLGLQQPVKVHDVLLYYKPIIVKNAVTVRCGCQELWYKFYQNSNSWKCMSPNWVLYSTANDPETANDPQNGPQMILDRKWSLKSTANDPVKTWGMEWILWDWLQKRTDYKKESFFSRLLKKKGRRTLHLRSIYTRWKKIE